MYTRNSLFLFFVLSAVLGCQQAPDIASPDASWTIYESTNQALRFEMPDGMRKNVRSVEPTAVLYENESGDFAISVLHGSDMPVDEEFVTGMIAVGLEGNKKLGEAKSITVGSAKGLRQDYRTLIGYKHNFGRTIAMTSGNDRIVFDISYAERFEDQLKPVFERVINSLEFNDPPSTKTRNVSFSQ